MALVEQLTRAGWWLRAARGVSEPELRGSGAVTYWRQRYTGEGARSWLGGLLEDGADAVDPWAIARRLSRCCATYQRSVREKGVLDEARRCQSRWCPHCAAALAGATASDVRRVLASLLPGGDEWRRAAGLPDRTLPAAAALVEAGRRSAVLVTLTQRARPGEPLKSSVDRLLSALRRLWGSAASPWLRTLWRDRAAGGWYGTEATRGWAGRKDGAARPARPARHWHAHIHMVLTGYDLEYMRNVVAAVWDDATAETGGEWGADPASRADGGWWRPIDLADLRGVYQATKYVCPELDSLSPDEVIELTHVADSAKLRGGWGVLREAAAEAEKMAAAGQPDPCPPPVPRPELGARLGLRHEVSADCPVSSPVSLAVVELTGQPETLRALEQSVGVRLDASDPLMLAQALGVGAKKTEVESAQWRYDIARGAVEEAEARRDALPEPDDRSIHRVTEAWEQYAEAKGFLCTAKEALRWALIAIAQWEPDDIPW